MSADIWLELPDGTPLHHTSDPDAAMWDLVPMRSPAEVSSTTFNLTYNLTPMLRVAGMPSWRYFIGMGAGVAGAVWQVVVDELRSDPGKYRAMNPPNGWGDYDGAVQVLSELTAACRAYPDLVVGGWL